MLRTITINLLTIVVLALGSQPILAQPVYDNLLTEQITQRKPHYSPLTRLQRIIRDAEIYEYLLAHPKVIKLQDIARRVWEKQTGSKRRVVAWSRRSIISPGELPIRAPITKN